MSERLSNDHLDLAPTYGNNSRVLEYDFPAIHVGVAEYQEGPTGCTVFHFPQPIKCGIDVRGGSPSTFATDNHNFSAGERTLDAICFTGGSVHGLEAVMGVTSSILALNNYSTSSMPRVAGATIYDYVGRANAIYPDKTLGKAAFANARPNCFPLGSVGAGKSAKVGKGFNSWESSGQGGAFFEKNGVKVAAYTVVNSMGAIMDKSGSIVRGYYDTRSGTRFTSIDTLMDESVTKLGNTTLTVVVTNLKLSSMHLRQLAKQIHSSMARAIHPFHTIDDGGCAVYGYNRRSRFLHCQRRACRLNSVRIGMGCDSELHP